MNNEEIVQVLQATILWLDKGKPEDYGIEPHFAKIGKKLADYLQGLNIQENERRFDNGKSNGTY